MQLGLDEPPRGDLQGAWGRHPFRATTPHVYHSLQPGQLGLRTLLAYALAAGLLAAPALALPRRLPAAAQRVAAAVGPAALAPVAVLWLHPAVGRTLLALPALLALAAASALGAAAGALLLLRSRARRDLAPPLALLAVGALTGLALAATRTLPLELTTPEGLRSVARDVAIGALAAAPLSLALPLSTRRRGALGGAFFAVTAAVAAAALAGFHLDGEREQALAPAPAAGPPRPPVLLIVVDTLRADFGTGSYDARDTTAAVSDPFCALTSDSQLPLLGANKLKRG